MASSTSNFKLRTFGVFACAAAVVLTFASISYTYPDSKYLQSRISDAFWQNKVHGHADHSFNIVISGDSRVYRGISPAAIQTNLPDTTIINYGFSSGGHNPMIFKAINTLLKQDGMRAVVLGITPYSLTPKAQLNEEYQNWLKKGPVSWDNNVQDIFHPWTISQIKKTIRQESSTPSNENNEYLNNGWVRSDYLTRDPHAALLSYQDVFDGNAVSDTVINDLMRQVKTWHDQGVLVIGYRPPTTPDMVALENAKSGYNEPAIRKAFQASGGIWISPKDRFESYDGSHLTPESAEKLSKILGAAIAQKAKAP